MNNSLSFPLILAPVTIQERGKKEIKNFFPLFYFHIPMR